MNTPYWRILLPEIQLKLLGQFLSAQNLSHKTRLSSFPAKICTAAFPPVRVQFAPQCICKDTNNILILNTFAQIYTLFNRTPK
jgi:hypothetical protein